MREETAGGAILRSSWSARVAYRYCTKEYERYPVSRVPHLHQRHAPVRASAGQGQERDACVPPWRYPQDSHMTAT